MVLRLACILSVVLLAGCARTRTWSGEGDVVEVDDPPRHVTLSHDAIAGLMPAMTMQFPVRTPEVLAGVAPGVRVRFQVVRENQDLVVTQIVPVGLAAGGARPGLHDHTPHHGGVVAMVGLQHLEALARPDGAVRVYVTDLWRRPVPLAGVSGTATLDLPAGRRTLPLVPNDEALEAHGPPLPMGEVRAHVTVDGAGSPLDVHFLLPLATASTGAGLVPVGGCEPPPDDGGGRRPRCVIRFGQPVTAVAVTPDAAQLLVAVAGVGVTVWRLPSVELITGLAPPPPVAVPTSDPPHGEAANALAVSPDGREVVAGVERLVLRYAVQSGRLLRRLAQPGGVIHHVVWLPDGERLLVGAFYDPVAHLVRAEDGAEVRSVPVASEAVSLAVSADGRLAAAGGEDGSVVVFDPGTDGVLRRLDAGNRPVEALAFAGDRLAAASPDGVLRLWNVARGELEATIDVGTPLFRLAAAPGGRLVASAGFDRTIRLHALPGGEVVASLPFHDAGVAALAWAGPVLLSGDTEGRLAVWDLGDVLAPP